MKSFSKIPRNSKTLLVLKISCFTVLIGRAYQHIFWDIPLRTFFWDEGLLKGIIELFSNASWPEVVTSQGYDGFILTVQILLGVYYGLAAIACLFIEKWGKKLSWVLPLSSILLFLLAMLYFKEKFYQLAQLFEYSSQMIAPLLLYFLFYKKIKPKTLFYFGAGAAAATFIAHGLYALNFYPRPGSFVDMTISILGVNESQAITFLNVIGWLDIVFAVGLFIPVTRNVSLYYCIAWGLLTALARPVAYVESSELWMGLHQYGFEMVYRLVHGGLPLFLLMWGIHSRKKHKKREPKKAP